MSVYDLLIDFGLASALILVGQLLRAKVTFFQKFFIPASMIAGFLGLALGSQGLKIAPFSSSIGSYSGALVLLIFAIVGINGFKLSGGSGAKEEVGRIVGFQIYRFFVFFLQFTIPILVAITLIKGLYPSINDSFGVLLAAGFVGGHGTAAAVGKTVSDLGWTQGNDIGMTFATIGILTGIFGGLIFIKWASKKGYTGYIQDFKFISGDLRTGLVSPENRQPIGVETINTVSLDTLCFHLSIILTVTSAGYCLNKFVLAPHVLKGIPDFSVIYLLSLVFFLLLGKTPVYNYVDRRINQKISGTSTDYLVFFGIASIKIPVVIEYAVPLLILTLTGILCVFLSVIPFGLMFNKDSWFERSIFAYGYITGVFAIGFVLLRVVDPDNKSKTVDDVAMTPLVSFVEIFVWSLVPTMLLAGQGWLVVGGATVVVVACVVIAKMLGVLHTTPPSARGFHGIDTTSKR